MIGKKIAESLDVKFNWNVGVSAVWKVEVLCWGSVGGRTNSYIHHPQYLC